MYSLVHFKEKVHRLISSKFPPVTLFDWADSEEELEQIALLEGLTNDRIQMELGRINIIDKGDWVGGSGSTPIMAAFTHIGYESRFTDGSYGIYYAAASLETAIRETVFHRERFYSASNERPCSISMREYVSHIKEPLIDISGDDYIELLDPDPAFYQKSQKFGKKIYDEKHWGLIYPSIRNPGGSCMAVFRAPALTIPIQGCHLRYIWNGSRISDVYKESKIINFK